MRRTGGIIPPGKVGLVMLAVALLPVALKNLKPLAKGLSKGLKAAADACERIADEAVIAGASGETGGPTAAAPASDHETTKIAEQDGAASIEAAPSEPAEEMPATAPAAPASEAEFALGDDEIPESEALVEESEIAKEVAALEGPDPAQPPTDPGDPSIPEPTDGTNPNPS